MVQDSKTYSPPSPDAELPPSYDSAITLSTAGPSTVSTENRDPPKQITHLFSGPPNAEPLLGRALVPASFITGIECFERGSGIVSHDPKLTDRKFQVWSSVRS